jgi:hypothetical protein
VYPDLVPHSELVRPNRSGAEKSFRGWAFASRTDDLSVFLVYFEEGCAKARLDGATPLARYEATPFDPSTGKWLESVVLTAGEDGSIALPEPPIESDLAIRLIRLADS